ncbi:MAG TPA: VWA domain-containing protein [Gaiellaceae bacterium]|nr:VWA domain-containing protein [Gaiellaceae bacterium]
MSFQSPWMLLGLLVVAAFVGLWLWAERRRARYAVRYTNLDVLATVVSGRHTWLRFVPAAILVLGLGALVVGLARPHVERTLLREKATVILVVDTSRSMQAKDVEPTRLGAAQEALRTFIDQAPDDLRIGFVVFAGEAQVATPPTDDHELVEAAITDIDEFLVFGGTAIGDALQTATLLGRQVTDLVPEEGSTAAPAPDSTRTLAQSTEPDEEAEEQESPVSILFLSDGAQTRGLLQPLEGAQIAKEANFPVYTIALGTPEGVIERGPFGGIPGQDTGELIPVPPDPDTLRAIAETTGGEFTEARTADALGKAYENLGSRLGREPGESEITWLFLAIGGVLLLLAGGVAAFASPRFP